MLQGHDIDSYATDAGSVMWQCLVTRVTLSDPQNSPPGDIPLSPIRWVDGRVHHTIQTCTRHPGTSNEIRLREPGFGARVSPDESKIAPIRPDETAQIEIRPGGRTQAPSVVDVRAEWRAESLIWACDAGSLSVIAARPDASVAVDGGALRFHSDAEPVVRSVDSGIRRIAQVDNSGQAQSRVLDTGSSTVCEAVALPDGALVAVAAAS